MLADLIIRVVVNGVRHVAIQDFKSGGAVRISTVDASRLIVLRTAKLGERCAQIALDLLAGEKNLHDSHIALVGGPLPSWSWPKASGRASGVPPMVAGKVRQGRTGENVCALMAKGWRE